MTREQIVRVKPKGSGGASFAAGEKYALKLAPAATSDHWADDSPITRAEFDAMLSQAFEIVPEPPLKAKAAS